MAKARLPKEPKPERICKRPECDVSFSPYRDSQEYCSTRCRALHYWMTHEAVKTDVGEQVVPLFPSDQKPNQN